MPLHFPSSCVVLVHVRHETFFADLSFDYNTLTFSSIAVTCSSSFHEDWFLICSTLHDPCSMASPYLTLSSKLMSSLMIFIRFLLSVWYRIASLAAVIESYSAQTHLCACSLNFTYHSIKQQPPCGIYWNRCNLTCCCMLSATFESASLIVSVSITQPT